MFHLLCCKPNSLQYCTALLGAMTGEVKAFSACMAMLNCCFAELLGIADFINVLLA